MTSFSSLEVPRKMDITPPTFFSASLPASAHGLKEMLRTVDDLLFVLDLEGGIRHCRASTGVRLQEFSLPVDMNIESLLPEGIRRKFKQSVEKYRQTGQFTLFESLLLLPGIGNWYEFRLIPTLGQTVVLFIWNVNKYRKYSRIVANVPVSIEKMVEGWSRSLYLRDFETEDHTRRVTELTLRLARRLGLPETDLVNIRRGAQVHDIGKIAIPDEILLKTGTLTDYEWSLMRQHPLIAVEMLRQISMVEPMLVIPRSHHERWDGSGYPDGLAGASIPLAARIFAFADVYDALTSDRPYRRAWSHGEALEHIRKGAGSHFDPLLVPEFIRMFY